VYSRETSQRSTSRLDVGTDRWNRWSVRVHCTKIKLWLHTRDSSQPEKGPVYPRGKVIIDYCTTPHLSPSASLAFATFQGSESVLWSIRGEMCSYWMTKTFWFLFFWFGFFSLVGANHRGVGNVFTCSPDLKPLLYISPRWLAPHLSYWLRGFSWMWGVQHYLDWHRPSYLMDLQAGW